MLNDLKLSALFDRWSWFVLPAVVAFLAAVAGWFLGLAKKAGESFAGEFGKVSGNVAADWIRERSAPFKVRYRTYLFDLVRHVDLKGFAHEAPFALELMDVFVDLSLDPKSFRNMGANPIRPLPDRLATGRHSIWEYLEQPDQRLAVIGAPGSGKTTLLKYIVLATASRREAAKHQAAKSLPVFIEIRKQSKAIVEKEDYSLADAARDQLGSFGKKAPSSWFDSKLDKGGCLVMIDGLDEVADPQRQKVANWVEKQVAAYSSNRYIVTSRPNGYRSNPILGFNTLEVRSFTPQDIRRFVNSWYVATEVAYYPEDSPPVRAKAGEGANGLLGKIRQSADLTDLASNPLLLTMIATVHRHRGSLPGSRVELYRDIASVFLGRRRQARELDFDLSPDQKQSVLQPLAYEMMLRRIQEIPETEACLLIEKPLSPVRPNTPAGEFLRGLESTSGLFVVERESGLWGFAHLTVQEFLASAHLREHSLGAALAQRVHEPWWHETVRLYVAQTDATAIIEACIGGNSPSTESLVLAIQCLEEAKTVNADSRKRFTDLLSDSVASPDPEIRRPVAEALLHLRLAKMEPLDENRFLSDFVSHAEYQLFLDELRTRGIFRQPDHWPDYQFAPGTASQPVTGVRASDAVEFAEWLSLRSAGKFLYRLPRAADESPAWSEDSGVASPGFWIETSGSKEIAGVSGRVIYERQAGLLAQPAVHARTLALAPAFERDLALELDRALALGLGIDRDLDRARALALGLDRAVELDRARTLALALNHDLALAFNHDLALAFNHDPTFALYLDRTLALYLANDRGLASDIASDLDLALDLNLALASSSARALANALELLAERDRASLEAKTSGRNLRDVLSFLSRYVSVVSFHYLESLRIKCQGTEILRKWTQRQEDVTWQKGLSALADQFTDVCVACNIDELQRFGIIPVIGGIRVVREPAST